MLQPKASATPTAAPAFTPSPKPSSSASSNATVRTVLLIPPAQIATAARRERSFVSPGTKGIVEALYAAGSPASAAPIVLSGADLSPSSPSCSADATTTGARDCTLIFPALSGTYAIVFTTYDEPVAASGAVPAGAAALATATIAVTLSAGSNTVNVALSGIVKSVVITPETSIVTDGAAATFPLAIGAFDASGSPIVAGMQTVSNGTQSETDTYAVPIVLTADDPSGLLQLTKDGGARSASVTLTASSDTVTATVGAGAAFGYAATVTARLASSGATAAPLGSADVTTLAFTGTGANFDAGSQTLSVVADAGASTLTVSNTSPNELNDGVAIVPTNAGTGACPAGAVAASNLAPAFDNAVSFAGYAAAQCSFSLALGTSQATSTLTVRVSANASPPPDGSVVVESSAGHFQTFDTNDPGITSTLATSKQTSAFVRARNGTTYVASSGTISEYAAGASGAAAPVATIAVAGSPGGLALDAAGNLYATEGAASEVVEYAPDLSKVVATLAGSQTGLAASGVHYLSSIGIDEYGTVGSGNVYVLTNTSILVFAPLASGTDNVAPIRQIPVSYGYPDDTQSMAVDLYGDVFFNDGSDDGIVEFSSGSSTQSAEYYPDGGGAFVSIAIDNVLDRLYVSPIGQNYKTQTPDVQYYNIGRMTAVPFLTSIGGTLSAPEF